jgi:hypothetical protein
MHDYTNGLAVARAYNKKHAIRKLVEQFDFLKREEEMNDKHYKRISKWEWPKVTTQNEYIYDGKKRLEERRYEVEKQAYLLEKEKRRKKGYPDCYLGTWCNRMARRGSERSPRRSSDRSCFLEELESAECIIVPDHHSFGVFVGGGS